MTTSSSHVCGHPNKTRRRSPNCRRRVAGDGYCYQHRGAGTVFVPAQRTTTVPVRSVAEPPDPVRTAYAVAAPGWRRTQGDRMRAILGDPLNTRARASGATLCDDLARLAASLEQAVEDAQGSLTDTITRTTMRSRTSVVARLVAAQLVDRVTAGPADQVATVVRGIRVTGVLLCVLEGRGLGRCRCLQTLAASARDGEVDAAVDVAVGRALEDGLEPFLPVDAAAVPG